LRRVISEATESAESDEDDAIRAAQAGDRAAFARVVSAYWDRLFRWLFQLAKDRHRAEDLTQETFLKALAALNSFQAGTNFRAWLFRIGHNNFVNLKRSAKRPTVALPDEMSQPDRPDEDPLTTAGEREELAKVAKAVQELPSDFRSALLLRAEQGLSFREVATVMGITEETARWRVFKARQKLVQILEG
jgi:RNA polymerase sigma-70 factor, ECF subfamily